MVEAAHIVVQWQQVGVVYEEVGFQVAFGGFEGKAKADQLGL